LKQKKSEKGNVRTTITQDRAVMRIPTIPFPRSFSSAEKRKKKSINWNLDTNTYYNLLSSSLIPYF